MEVLGGNFPIEGVARNEVINVYFAVFTFNVVQKLTIANFLAIQIPATFEFKYDFKKSIIEDI